jgi:RNA polymerase sigma factor (sigma-70 family)
LNQAHLQTKLIELCKQGDRKAQFELYKLYSKAMYNICMRILHNSENAEDAMQNAFVDIFSKMDSYRYESPIGAWIKRIVVNNCINQIKKRKLDFIELNEGTLHIPEQLIVQSEPKYSVQLIQKAIGQLPEGYRVVFCLYAMEGYDHEEIGEILGVTEATSKSQYSRAKAKLRGLLTADK